MESSDSKGREVFRKAREFFLTDKVLSGFAAFFALLPIPVFFGTTPLYFDQMQATFAGLYPMLGILACLPTALFLLNLFVFRKKSVTIVSLVFGLAVALEHFVLLTYALGMMFYFFYEGAPYFLAVIFAAVIIPFIIELLVDRKRGDKTPFLARHKKAVAVVATAVFLCVTVFGIFHLLPTYFTSDPVVFAVEDEYQIAWTTSTVSTGAVTVGEMTYCDSKAGANRISKVHKVSVPMDALDEAKGFSVTSIGVINNRAYLSVSANKVSKECVFRPVDISDGLQIYNVSDNHLKQSSAAKAAGFWGDKTDLIIANGDHMNDVSSEYQVTLMYRFLHKAAGACPIIITRGNHEARGRLLENLPDYIGATEEGNMYYNTVLGGVRFLVLDTASDHSDEEFLTRPTTDFSDYFKRELEWVEGQVDIDEPLVVLCHMAIPNYYSEDGKRFGAEFFNGTLEKLNSLNVSLMLSGHTHRTEFVPAGNPNEETGNPNEGKINRADFPCIIGSKRSDEVSDKPETFSATQFTGAAVEFKDGVWRAMFTNSKHEVLAEYEI